MTVDPWFIIGWLLVVLLAAASVAVTIVVVWAIRQRRHFVAEFERTSAEIERAHDEIAAPLRRSRGRFRIDP